MDQLVKHVADATAARTIKDMILEPQLASIQNKLLDRIAEMLRPHHDGHPITYDDSFTEIVQKIRVDRFRSQLHLALTSAERESLSYGGKLDELLERQVASYEKNMDRFAAAEALDCSEAYYKVSTLDSVDRGGGIVGMVFG